MSDQTGIGLALSGGAARGFAHVGVLKVLQSNGIPISAVAGTSAGSIVGALVCGGYDWREILDVAEALQWNALVAPTLSGMGLVNAKKMESFIGDLLGEVSFDELEIPLQVVTVDITRGEEVVLSSGSVARAVRASSAVPGIFEPVIDGDQVLVDGGVIDNLPSRHVRAMGPGTVVGVDLNAQRPDTQRPVNLIDVTFRSFAMLLNCTSSDGREAADVLVQPDLTEFSYHDLSRSRALVEAGERAAEQVLDAILTG